MKPSTHMIIILAGLALAYVVIPGAAAQDPPGGRIDPAQQEAMSEEETAALVEAGKVAMKSLEPLAPGETMWSYFEVKSGPRKAVGYVIISLEASPGQGEPVYLLRTEMFTKYPTMAKARVFVNAKLRPTFEPIEIEAKHALRTPPGEDRDSVQRAVIGPDKVKLSVEMGDQRGTSEVPRPPPPFIYGIETMIQRLDYATHNHFIAREFDLETGKVRTLVFSAGTLADGTQTIATWVPGGGGSYQFWFGRDGKLLRWSERSLPLMFVQTTKERAERLKKKLTRGWRNDAAKPAPKPD